MGRCYKCNTELRLEGEEYLCDNCNLVVEYKCWNCKGIIPSRDEETRKKREECSSCKYFYCPSCGVCGNTCKKIGIRNQVLKILGGQLNLEGDLVIKDIHKKIKYIVDSILDGKDGEKIHKVCPYGVYQSYARGKKGQPGRIKQLLAKMNGIGVKSELDMEGFKERFNQILGLDEDINFTIKNLRADGRYGQEERDACNLGVCMGETIAQQITTKKGKKATIYKKIESKGKCHYLRQDNFISKRCPQCNKDYNNSKLEYYNPKINTCPNCKRVRGKNKGVYYDLIKKETNTFTCNCPYNNFKIIEQEDQKEDDIEKE